MGDNVTRKPVRFGIPTNRREARSWVRQHWADMISNSDMGAIGDMENDFIDDVYQDECRKIAERLLR